jgi:transcriptional regulator with XRE-family HTH domain
VPKHNERDLQKAEFARRLERLMNDKGWNQSDVARAASQHLPKGEDFRRDSVHTYLNQLAIPRPKQLNALAKAFGVTPDDLLPGVRHAGETMPYSMQPVMGEAGKAWLRVDMKVSMRTALAVLAMLDDSK